MADDKVAAALDEARRDIASTRDAEHFPRRRVIDKHAPDLLAAVEAVLALHPADKDEDYPREQPLCPACSEWWPCDTIRAVSRALLGEKSSPEPADDLVDMGVLPPEVRAGSGRGRNER